MEKKKNVTYTSTLPSVVMEEVVEYAAKKKITKNKVIEMALRNYLDAEIMRKLDETFELAMEDKDLMVWAESNLDEYNQQLKEIEK